MNQVQSDNQTLKFIYLAIGALGVSFYAVTVWLLVRLATEQTGSKLHPVDASFKANVEAVSKIKDNSLRWVIAHYHPPQLLAQETVGDWKQLEALPDLEIINLAGSLIDDDALSHLKYQPLKMIDLSACKNINGSGLRFLQQIPSLRVCQLQSSSLQESELKNLNPNLWEVNLSFCPITDAGVEELTRLKHLKILSLSSTKISANAINSIAKLPELIYVDISNCSSMPLSAAIDLQTRLAHTAVKTSTSLPTAEHFNKQNLKNLIRHSPKISLAGIGVGGDFNELSQLHQLTFLSLPMSGMTDSGMKSLKALPLRYLDIDECSVHARGLKEVQNIPTLVCMKAVGIGIDNEDLKYLNPNLVKLDLKRNGITDGGLPWLARLPHLQMLRLEANPISPEGLKALRTSKTLKYIDIRGISQLSAQHAKELQASIPGSMVLVSTPSEATKSSF